MRDPLSLIPVRYKLPLTFAFLGVVAFGLGGYVVTTTARDALGRQIRMRLDDRAANTHLVIDEGLELLGRRVEDFASDGHIRIELDRLRSATAAAAGRRPSTEIALVRHLRTNKLPLVAEFVDAYVLDAEGDLLFRAYSTATTPAADFNREGLWYGPLSAPQAEHPYPTFVLSTPVRSIDSARRLGYLQLVVRADLWADHLRRALSRTPMEGLRISLRGLDGYRLSLISGAVTVAGEQDLERLAFSSTNARNGWKIELSVDRGILTLPISTLVATFVYTGIALVVLSMLLILPSQQFLLKPLAELENAARRLTAGDFSARVGHQSDDEVGHLAQAFDVMAGAIEERTLSLARAAEDLGRREADVRVERDRLDTVIHSMEDGLFILDRNGRVTLANAAAKELLEELGHGRAVSPRDCFHGSRAPRSCFHCLANYRRPAHPCVVASGDRVFELQATSLRDAGGEEAERVFVGRDVSERVRQAAQQAHQERLAVLGEVAAVMAHEMNNPLAAISMFSQMLLDGLDESSTLRTHAEVVHRNTVSCKRTIRSLLDMASTTSTVDEDFDVRDLVDDVVEFLGPVAERGRSLLRVDAEADDGLVHADELQLRQALVNLVMNAIQATGSEDGGEVMVGTMDRPDQLAIRVSDNGSGIPEALQERVFEPFFTTKPPGEGTGLGLPTTRRIVESQGGRLTLVASSPAGTTLEIVIPRAGMRGTVPDRTAAVAVPAAETTAPETVVSPR